MNFDADSVHIPAEVVAEETAAQMFAMVASVVGPWTQVAETYLTRLLTPDPKISAMITEMRAMKAIPPEERSTDDFDAFVQKYLPGIQATNASFDVDS